MERKPVIGITMTQEVSDNTLEIWQEYIDAVKVGGGVPILLPTDKRYPFYDEYLEMIDGLLLSGGQDIEPKFYGEESIGGFEPDSEMTPDRDEAELALAKNAMEKNMPILGICRGLQVLAVVNGGSLYQDIGTQTVRDVPLRHCQASPWWHECHAVGVSGESILCRALGSSHLGTNSIHHQAVKKMPPDFIISARSADGMVEAIESTLHDFVLGVQWHPERLLPRNDRWSQLFRAFCAASSEYRARLR